MLHVLYSAVLCSAMHNGYTYMLVCERQAAAACGPSVPRRPSPPACKGPQQASSMLLLVYCSLTWGHPCPQRMHMCCAGGCWGQVLWGTSEGVPGALPCTACNLHHLTRVHKGCQRRN